MLLSTVQKQMFSGLKLLILDNNNDFTELLSLLFEDLGVEVICTKTANQAMEQLDNATVDVIISELALPGEDGYSFMRKVKSHQMPNGREIPALAISGWFSNSHKEEAMLAGFNNFISKPISLEEITSEVAALVQGKNYQLN